MHRFNALALMHSPLRTRPYALALTHSPLRTRPHAYLAPNTCNSAVSKSLNALLIVLAGNGVYKCPADVSRVSAGDSVASRSYSWNLRGFFCRV